MMLDPKHITGIWEWHIPTGAVTVNEYMASSLGYTRDALNVIDVHTWQAWIHPTDRPIFTAVLRRHLHGELDHFACTLRLRHKQGSWQWMQVRGYISKWNKDVQPVVIAGSLQGMVETHPPVYAPGYDVNTYRLLFETLNTGVWQIDQDGYTSFVNMRMAQMLGHTVEAMQRQHFFSFMDPQETKAAQYYLALRQRSPCKQHEITLVHKAGHRVHVIMGITPLYDNTGGYAGAVASVLDVSSLRRSIEASNFLSSIIMKMFDAIVITDEAFKINYINDKASELYGYTLDELRGETLAMFQVDRPNSKQQREICNAITTEQNYMGEAMHQRRDGSHFFCEFKIIPCFNDQGQLHAHVSIHRDITRRRQANATLQATNIQLREATQYAHDMMERAKALAIEADRANQAKSEFLASMSHEIRTPMNGVIGMTDLLLDTKLDSQQRYYAESILSSAESLLSLINDILDFSKIEAGKLDLECIDFNLLTLLDDFVTTLAWKAHQKGLEFVCAAEPLMPIHLRGDPGRLRQILNNLGSNAIKFTHSGEVIVRVHLLEECADNVLLRFTVKDTGIGIDPSKHARLFTNFAQLDSSTTREYGGTGLGLAICQRLTELMQGELGLESQLGHGSTFWFTARLHTSQHAQALAPPISSQLEGVRVLIVDDHPTNCEIQVDLLQSWGMRPAQASHGRMALNQLKQAIDEGDPFTVALIDLEMPVMDGEMLGKAIQSDASLAGLRCIILPSLTVPGDLQRYKASGFHAYLPKPIRQQDLHNVLRNVLDASTLESDAMITRHSSKERLQVGIKLFEHAVIQLLLVEDDPINQAVALGALKRLGLDADIADNGEQALQALSTIEYDLVFMDVHMPVLDGLQATRKIRSQQSGVLNPDIPIIAMTASAMCGDRERFLATGMNDYIPKPLPVDAIQTMLKRWLPHKFMPSTAHILPVNPAPSPFPILQGFDTVAALERMGGNRQAYRGVLNKFSEHHKDSATKLKAFIAANDLPAAKILAHSIKGVAANIGALELEAIAEQLEHQLDAHKPECITVLEIFEQKLTQTLHRIQPLLSDQTPSASTSLLSTNELLSRLKTLAEMLAQYDTQGIDDLREWIDQVADQHTHDTLIAIQTRLEEYDFDAAQELLTTLCTTLSLHHASS